MEAVVLILCTVPDRETGEKIAAALTLRRLAACVNIIPGLTSVFRWQAEIQRDSEVLLMVKSTADRFSELEHLIRELHPYQLPEIIALPVSGGSEEYISWVVSETRPTDASP